MPRKNVELIQIHVPIGAREKITTCAKNKGYPVTSDYIRTLIEADMKTQCEDIDLSVDRGGDRYNRTKDE